MEEVRLPAGVLNFVGAVTGTAVAKTIASGFADPKLVTETVVLKGVNFCNDCDHLSPEAKAILDADAMAIIKHHPNATFEVAGHTDANASEAYNLDLSQRRAGNVRSYLVQQGVNAGSMSAVGYGESQPVADNATAAGRAQNRRVELRITETR